MNAPDNHLDLAAPDTDVLAGIDRALAQPELVTHPPESLEVFCTHLAAATPTADPLFRDLLAQRLTAALTQRSERAGALARLRSFVPRPRAGRAGLRAPRRRVASVILAALVAGSGAGVYLHGQSPTPVDAQTVLHRAAATSPGANVATHATYRLSSGSDLSGTADVWIGFDGTGTAAELSLAETMQRNGASIPELSASISAAGQSLLQLYDPMQPSAAVPSFRGPAAGPGQALEGMLVGTLLAQKLSGQPSAFTMQRETVDGVPVYALTLATPASATYYFNARSYMLEGVDWVQDGRSWQARLEPSSYHTMPLSAVPANTFPAVVGGRAAGSAEVRVRGGGGTGLPAGGSSGSGPVTVGGSTPGGVSMSFSGGSPSGAGAHLAISVSVPGLSNVDLMPALATACRTTPQAFTTALTAQTGGASLLAVCRQTNAGILAGQLVSALQAPVQSALDGLVRSGSITAREESADLANLNTQLTHLVTSGIGLHLSGPSPSLPQP